MNQHIKHLETITSHDDALLYISQFNRDSLITLCKILDVPTTGNKATIALRIVSNTVDYRLRSQAIREL